MSPRHMLTQHTCSRVSNNKQLGSFRLEHFSQQQSSDCWDNDSPHTLRAGKPVNLHRTSSQNSTMNDPNAARKSLAESYFSLRASQALTRAFAPITTPELASYIFSETPKIPARAFSSSVVVHISHKLMHTGLSDPRRAFTAPTVMHKPTTESASVNLVLTPLRREGDKLLGVVSASGVTPDGSVMPFSHLLNSGIQRGRFVYDFQKRHTVCVIDGAANKLMGVVSANWINPGVRERLFFAVPRRQYSFEDMPKQAVVVLTNLEYRVSKMEEGRAVPGHNADVDSLFESLAEARTRGDLDVVRRNDGFDMSAMTEVIGSLAKSLAGVYYGPNLKRDVMNIETGELSSRASGKMVATISMPDDVVQNSLRRLVAQDYFLQLSPPGSERWFSPSEDERNVKAAMGVLDGEIIQGLVGDGDPYRELFQPYRVDGGSEGGEGGSGSGTVSDNKKTLSHAELKKVRDETRRMRNRLSAARSNERRKAREKAQMMELEMLKRRKALLLDVQKRLADENDVLKGRVETYFSNLFSQ